MKSTASFELFENTTICNTLLASTTSHKGNGTNVTEIREEYIKYPEEYRFFVMKLAALLVPTFFGFIFIIGILGNSAVIAVMTKKNTRRQSQGQIITNNFILNLAISDLFFLFFCVPFQAVIYFMKSWPFGSFMCVFCEFCQKVSMQASIYTLVALSVDRYIAVVHATSANHLRTRKRSLYCLVTIWIFSIGLGIPAVFVRQEVYFEGRWLCIHNFNVATLYRAYIIVCCVIGYVIPLILIFCCYVNVLRAMSKNAKSNAASQNKSSQESRKRVTKIVSMLVLLFATDWFLHHLTEIWIEFGYFPFNEYTFVLKMLSHVMSYANSCVNPLIYAFVSQRFRDDFKEACTSQYIANAFRSLSVYSQRFRNPRRDSELIMNRNRSALQLNLKPRRPVIRGNGHHRLSFDCRHANGITSSSCSTCQVEIDKLDVDRKIQETTLLCNPVSCRNTLSPSKSTINGDIC